MTEQSTASRPNVIWVFADQLRAQALGHAGDPNVSTPNIDRLAAEGWRSTAAVAGCPLCGPFRGSLLTSRYPSQCVPGNGTPMPAHLPTIANVFDDAGYHTAWFGKWHLSHAPAALGPKDEVGGVGKVARSVFATVPKQQRGGFSTWLGYENNDAPFDVYLHGHDGEQEVSHFPLPGYETDALTDALIDHLRARAVAGEPFFAAVSYQPPHDPYVAPAKYMSRHRPARIAFRGNVPGVARVREQAARDLAGYYAAIECVDDSLGRIRDALSTLGLADNTHVIFFSDHGDLHGSHGYFRKHSPWEEAIRIPFIIGGMGMYGLRRGEDAVLVNHIDIAPTTLGLCGIEVPAWMAGTDYSSHRLRGGVPVAGPGSALLQYIEPTPWSWCTDRPWRGIVAADGWKYVCLEGQPWLMFDLREDPLEQVNLAHSPRHGKQRAALEHRLQQWLAEAGDTFTLPSSNRVMAK